MAEKVIFFGGLPRACSTLMVETLRQNPRFGVTPTSALPGLAFSAGQGKANPEWAAHYDQEAQERSYRSAMRGFITGWFPDHPVGIDKSRGWLMKWPEVKALFENPKLIAPIRDLRGIVASMEKKVKANPTFNNWGPEWRGKTDTLAQRVEMYLSALPLGPALASMQERLEQRDTDGILFLRAEDFAAGPAAYLKIMYKHMEEEWFEHDVENVTQDQVEIDSVHHSIFADHKIHQGAVKPLVEDWGQYITPQISEMLLERYSWFYQTFYPQVLQQRAA